MKTPPIVITLGGKGYSVRIRSEHLDRFYEIVRTAALNKVLNSSPLLDDEGDEELWTIFSSTGVHRMIIKNFIGSLTSVSGDENHSTIVPGTLVVDMISSLSDDE